MPYFHQYRNLGLTIHNTRNTTTWLNLFKFQFSRTRIIITGFLKYQSQRYIALSPVEHIYIRENRRNQLLFLLFLFLLLKLHLPNLELIFFDSSVLKLLVENKHKLYVVLPKKTRAKIKIKKKIKNKKPFFRLDRFGIFKLQNILLDY